LAALLRFVWVLVLVPPRPNELVWDSANYHDAAIRLLTRGYFAYGSGPISARPNAITMPGYTVFVSAVYSIFGTGSRGILAVWLIQAALGVLTVWLIYLIGSRLGGLRVGLIGALLAALYPPAIFLETELMTETLYAAVFALFVYQGLRSIECLSVRRFLLVGVLGGLAALIRPVAAPLVVLPLVIALLTKRVSLRFAAKLGIATLLGIALLLAPWVARNYRLHHRLIVFTTAAANPTLVSSYWPAAPPKYASVWPTSASDDELALTEAWSREARERNDAAWRTNPLGYVMKHVRMLWVAVTKAPGLLWLDGSPMTPFQIWFNRAVRAMHIMISLLAAAAVIVRPKDRGVWLLAASGLYALVAYALILPLARYAFPTVLVGVALAAITIDEGVRMSRGWRRGNPTGRSDDAGWPSEAKEVS
jgi:hypothetical protein